MAWQKIGRLDKWALPGGVSGRHSVRSVSRAQLGSFPASEIACQHVQDRVRAVACRQRQAAWALARVFLCVCVMVCASGVPTHNDDSEAAVSRSPLAHATALSCPMAVTPLSLPVPL